LASLVDRKRPADRTTDVVELSHALIAPSTETALIRQIHITAAHAICGRVEQELFGAAGREKTSAL
jgi:hypothetical protein